MEHWIYHISTVGWVKNLSRDTTISGPLFLQGIQLDLKGEGVNFWLYTVYGGVLPVCTITSSVAMMTTDDCADPPHKLTGP